VIEKDILRCLYEPIIDFATWWRYFSGQSIKIAFSTTKMAPPGGDIKFVTLVDQKII